MGVVERTPTPGSARHFLDGMVMKLSQFLCLNNLLTEQQDSGVTMQIRFGRRVTSFMLVGLSNTTTLWCKDDRLVTSISVRPKMHNSMLYVFM